MERRVEAEAFKLKRIAFRAIKSIALCPSTTISLVRTELTGLRSSSRLLHTSTAITMVKLSSAALAAAVMLPTCAAFAPASSYLTNTGMKSLVATNMIPAELVTEVPAALLSAADVATNTATAAASSTNLLSFSDQ
eukprot:scaffold7367_cov63-Skeletonema_marinoi.AAC.1